jgi:hypothetical protein
MSEASFKERGTDGRAGDSRGVVVRYQMAKRGITPPVEEPGLHARTMVEYR